MERLQSYACGSCELAFVYKETVKVKVAQSCPTLCDPIDCTVHGILQARILEWVAFPFSRRVFPTQESNWGLLHCRQILYQLSYQGISNSNRYKPEKGILLAPLPEKTRSVSASGMTGSRCFDDVIRTWIPSPST